MTLPHAAVSIAAASFAPDLTSLGEIAAAVIGLYLLLVAAGRLLKRRFGARLGVVYQLFCISFSIYIGERVFAPDIFGEREAGVASAFFGAGVFVRLLDQYFWRWFFERKRQVPVPKFIREVAAGLVYLAVSLLVLEFGYQKLSAVPGLLAGSGIIAIIIGLAMQDALGNIIAGLTLQLSRPFKAGDWLLLDNQHVKAIEINWRSSRFVTNDDVQLDIPNQQIVKQTVVNYHGGGSRHAMRLDIGVDYDAPPNRVKEILVQATANASGVMPEPPPNIFLKSFGDSAIVYEIRFWMDDHRLLNIVGDSIRTNVWYALRRAGIRIPFPIRTLQIERHLAAGSEKSRASAAAISLLVGQPLFKGVADAHLRFLVEQSPIQRYGIGEAVIREGAEGASMFVLMAGKAGVNVTSSSNQSTRVATLKTGDCFGEMSLLTGEKRSASVVAINDCEVLEITKGTFAEVIAQDPDLLPRLSDLLAKRQMETEGILQSRSQQPNVLAATEEEYRAGFLKKLRSFFEL